MTQQVFTTRLNPTTLDKLKAMVGASGPAFVVNTDERNAKFPKAKSGVNGILFACYWGHKSNNITVYFNYKLVWAGEFPDKTKKLLQIK